MMQSSDWASGWRRISSGCSADYGTDQTVTRVGRMRCRIVTMMMGHLAGVCERVCASGRINAM